MTDKTERQAEQDTENLNVFAVKTPWVATTPNTRVSNTTPAQEEMSVHKLQSSGKDSMGSLPPEPTLPMPATAPDANRMLEHLTGLKQAMGQLPEELEKKLLELQDASKANEKLLNHGHLNRLGKIQRQLQTTRDKVDKLDQDWKGFVGQVQERFQKHKELFLETRKQLCLTFQQKQQELVQVKAEIARASQSLMANVAEIGFGRDGRWCSTGEPAGNSCRAGLVGGVSGGRDGDRACRRSPGWVREKEGGFASLCTQNNFGNISYQSHQGSSQAKRPQGHEEGSRRQGGCEPLISNLESDGVVDSDSPTIDCLLRDVFQGFWPWESHVPCIGPIQPGDKVPSVAFNPIVEICCYVVEEASDYEGGYDARGRGEDGVKRTCSVESFGHFPFSGSIDELCAKSEVDWVCPPISATVDVDDVVHYSEDNLDLCSDAHRLLNPDLVCPVVRDDIPVWLCRSEGLVDPPAFVVGRDHEEVEIDDAPSEEDAYVVIDNWLVVEQALQDFDLDPTRPLPVVTFGLHGIGIGRRDTYIISMDPHHLRELWADAVPPNAVAVAFFVTPQPLQELQIDQGLVLVVQIDPPNVEPFDYRPSLMMQCSMNGVLLQEPSACYLSAVTSRDELQSRHPGYDICLPQGYRLCRVVYNGVVVETREPLVAWTCALNKLVISERPFQFQQAQCWYPDGEDVARRAMRMFEAGTTQFRLILHQAGFRPTVVHVGYFDLAQPELLRGLFPVELRQVLEYLKFLEVDDFHFIVHPSGVPRRPHVFILQWLDDS